jgi:ribosomal protein S18 acetylase RimI-like enzyme
MQFISKVSVYESDCSVPSFFSLQVTLNSWPAIGLAGVVTSETQPFGSSIFHFWPGMAPPDGLAAGPNPAAKRLIVHASCDYLPGSLIAVSASRIVEAAGLSDEQLAGIERLKRACVEDGRLKLEWETLRSRPHDQVRDFLYYTEPDGRVGGVGEVVGFLGLYNFGPGPTEVCGMVHPSHRREGIFTQLLAAANRRSLPAETADGEGRVGRLLIVNQESTAGRAFAEAYGAAPEHSEYSMTLTKATVPADLARFRRHEGLVVRPAIDGDRVTLAEVLSEAFSPSDGRRVEEVKIDGVTAVEYGGATIGTLRTEVVGTEAYVAGFAITSEMRGRGFGHQVLSEVMDGLMSAGIEKVHLDVATDNARALGLYLDLGFEQVGAMDYYAYAFTPGST